ncbi:uncharacterized protein LOC131190868 [Ahaetulla prasina]|uniref:uncharacterized protein LOC131190868 n=1 Tax=Ahaetulla prasina TaxID=499056 RepID=UPI0026495AF8|nr:uncharacterized protein LOC131190868 [Ahaetulla prasina]
MPLYRVFLWLLSAVLVSFLPGGLCGFFLHSLSYFYLQLSEPSQGLPQFFIRSYLDDQPITRFDSLTRKTEPLVPWMEEEEAEKEAFLGPEWIFRAGLEKLSKLNHQAEGLHTWQAVLGCELREDGSKGGFLHYGYNGMDFISFDKETLRWVTAQPQAQKVKEKWEDDPGWSERNKSFLEKTCIEGLQRHLSYKNKTLQRTEPPVGQVTSKVVDDSLEVLICQAFGFYPKEIQATWTRDREVCKYGTLPRNLAPNSDGTYYVWLSIEIDPKERDRFQCHLEHEGLQEPLVLAFQEETGWWTPWAIVAASIFGGVILFLMSWWRRRRRNNRCQELATCHDQAPSQRVPSFPGYGTEVEIQRPLFPQTKLTSETLNGRRISKELGAGGRGAEGGDRALSLAERRYLRLQVQRKRNAKRRVRILRAGGPGRPQGSSAVFSSWKFSRVGLLCESGRDQHRRRRLSDLSLENGGWRGMKLPRAPLLLLGTVLGSFVPGALCGAPSHSLCYSYLRLSEPSQRLPQLFIRSYLDDQPIARYDSLTRKTEPLVPWMEEVEKETFLPLEWVFRADLEKVLKLDRHAGEPPVGKVTRKVVDESLEVLICQAFGFYPKEIQATWTRDGEACEYETLPRNVAPNSDGTYYVWLSIEIDPKERDRFQCHLKHEGLQEPLVLAWKEETATGWLIPVGIGAAVILAFGIVFLTCK